jgi:flagellar biosynthesis component FlhA
MGELLTLFARAPADDDVDRIVERVHREFAATLPGADVRSRLVNLPPEVEERVAAHCQAHAGQVVVAVPEKEAEDLVHDLYARVGAQAEKGDAVLVVARREVRPAVRYLSAQTHSQLPVIALGELPEARRLSIYRNGGSAAPEAPL